MLNQKGGGKGGGEGGEGSGGDRKSSGGDLFYKEKQRPLRSPAWFQICALPL